MGNAQQIPKRDLEDWKRKYNLPKDKVDLTFRAFNSQKGKNGQITKDKFLDVMTKEGAAEREFAEAIFESFDKDSSGTIDVREYMALMGVSFGGTIDDKLEASFRLFDEDGNGELDRQEVERMLILVMKSMLKKMSAPSEQVLKAREAEIQRIIDEIFAKVDADNSGTIDLEEFKVGFKEHPDICNFFKQF
ncbi:EF hand domain containing protein [Acanthamoeba castellanii str. Neff]|uniref:EF hand domain containing protein n=1 Tax=Acanthamoeba castellanii (strain ATCC 30010 / Neff) TaxID=1257118 RepID=L8GYX7_ACACF|nr:EF hand domain containing protein [Acanthamoeba castellanii str. Neff]ELR18137.1 EF hand domain containing protein [Acanthamoeba castellanii str. Neff]